MDADAHLHLVLAELEGRLAGGGHRAGGERHAHGARAADDLVAERLQRGEVALLLRCGADDLLDDQRSRHAAAAGGVERVLHRDIVVDDDGLDPPPCGLGGHLPRHLEVHDVALVVLDDEERAGAAVRGLDRRHHLVRRGRGEDLAGAGGVEHADPDETGMQGLMARAAAGDQRDLARRERPPADELALLAQHDDVGMRLREAVEALGEDIVHGIDQLLHSCPP